MYHPARLYCGLIASLLLTVENVNGVSQHPSKLSWTLEGQLDGHPAANPRHRRPNVHLPAEIAGIDNIVKTLVSVFDHADVLALGESHQRKFDSDLRIRLVRHPDFARKVRVIVVEFGNTADQAILDRYVRGDDVPLAALRSVWRNAVSNGQDAIGVWDSPVYAEFLATVREINKRLPADRRVRVFGGDPPAGSDLDRDSSAVSVLKEQVFDKHAKALVVYGSGHLDYAEGKIVTALQTNHPGRTFVVRVQGGPHPEYQRFEEALRSSSRPVLVSMARPPFRDFSAEEFLGHGDKALVNGAWVDVVRYRGLTLGQMEDACVYVGMTPAVEAHVRPDS